MASATVAPLNPLAWLLAPGLASAAACLLFALPLKVFGLQLPEPVFAVVPAFAWAVIRPSVLPPFALILIGLFQDVLWGGPPGLWPLSLLAAYGLAFSSRAVLIGQGFWSLGVWYAGCVLVAFGAALGLAWLATGAVADLVGVALQTLASLALYPLAWRLVDRFEDADVRFR